MNDFLSRLKSRRSVLERTRPSSELPAAVLYVDWQGSGAGRRVLDAKGAEHTIPDAVLQSHYRHASGAKAKKLIAEHWTDAVAKPGTPASGAG